jgi:hypothetical protein
VDVAEQVSYCFRVYVCAPLDEFTKYLRTVEDVRKRLALIDEENADLYYAIQEDYGMVPASDEQSFAEYYSLAHLAFMSHQQWEEEQRHEAYVGYCPGADSPYFIFKLHNNGTTFIVGAEDLMVPVTPESAQGWPEVITVETTSKGVQNG